MTNQSFLASIQFTSGRDGTGSAPVPTSPAGQHRTPTQTCGAASRTYTPLALAEFNLILLLQLLVPGRKVLDDGEIGAPVLVCWAIARLT